MKRKIRREILCETKRLALVMDSKSERALRCALCEEESQLLSPVLVAGLLDISTRVIYRLVENGLIHFYEDDTRELLVCYRSVENLRPDEGKKSIIKTGE